VNLPLRIVCLLAGEQNPNLKSGAFQGSRSEQVALSEAAMPVLGEGRVIRYRPIQTKPAEPPVGQIEVNLVAQAPLRSDTEAVTNQEHPDHQFGSIEGRPVML
jgi:hypothetical protein